MLKMRLFVFGRRSSPGSTEKLTTLPRPLCRLFSFSTPLMQCLVFATPNTAIQARQEGGAGV